MLRQAQHEDKEKTSSPELSTGEDAPGDGDVQALRDPGSANMAPHAVLEEIGAAHELVRVDIDRGEHRDAAYWKLNRNARVPTLAHDGMIMYERRHLPLPRRAPSRGPS